MRFPRPKYRPAFYYRLKGSAPEQPYVEYDYGRWYWRVEMADKALSAGLRVCRIMYPSREWHGYVEAR